MKSTINALGVLLLLVCNHALGQACKSEFKCHSVENKRAAKTTVADLAEDKYDIRHVKFDLSVSNTSTHLEGSVSTTAKVTGSSFNTYVFELIPDFTIDSVVISGISLPFTTAGVVRTVTLPATLPVGSVFTAQVYYIGTPPNSALYYDSGINCIADPTWGNMVTFTHGESYYANQWWPCKQSLRDKIDSVDMWLTIPDTLKAGSNGLLKAVTPIDATHNRYEWKERYPIDYYLISFSVANYMDYSYYMHFTGSPDSMLVQNYIYNNPAVLTAYKDVIDSTGMMIDYFSTLFGRYPFWKEKYGHCLAPEGGGMEHQTMTTLGFFDTWLTSHELSHQWFGDNVTCGSWADICVNEGFASYCADLFADHFWSHATALSNIKYSENYVSNLPGGFLFVDDTTDQARIFDGRLSYSKGEALAHMLRFLINDDAVYFQILQNYQSQFRGGNATIEDLKNVTIAATGLTVNSMNLDTFFNQWAYLEGYPKYVLRWHQIGTDVWIRLDQTTSVPASVPLFRTPIEVKLHAATGDTVVRFFNDLPIQIYHTTWDRTVISPSLDPNAGLIYKLLGTIHDVTLGVNNAVVESAIKISPNPATTEWTISNVARDSKLILTDMSGRRLWQGVGDNNATAVPATHLAAGMYMLQVKSDAGSASYKLIKE
ncbi:hypothetical protein CJD36_011700 [Flavipsychrobacter stenotrophus]|uniref:Aminopeptidase N n=1 Tax=Flavipsychrobacter stenotrophus TaxID=2077091 RepID=A0A2S7SUP1_9BACT|nr:M1 family aminopeptidase [Flavipsychrobacter stenotrophus]PQJ10630.1 hypothetical protein CJD36_011700 [Flavipsychrobacter stenotrophus]